MRYISILMLYIVSWSLMPFAVAQETDLQRMNRVVAERFPGSSPDHISLSPVPGIFEIGVGGSLLYMTADGRYAFTGKLFDVETRTDLSERVLGGMRLKSLATVKEERMIIFEPKGETKHTITTFTAIDCPYCRKMHQEMDQLNDNGIRVRYMLYPRAGVDSDSYDKAVSVWCAKDRKKELTLAKSGKRPEQRECPNPVKEHMTIAQRLGLGGTPMTITDTGEKIQGYVPADQMTQRLDAAKLVQQ